MATTSWSDFDAGKRIVGLALAFLIAGSLQAPGGPAFAATVTGTVFDRDSGQPLPHAIVRVLGDSIRGETRSDGSFVIRSLPIGRHQVAVRLVGYRPALDSLNVPESDSLLILHFSLEPVAFALSEIVVRASAPIGGPRTDVLSRQEVEMLPGTVDDLTRAVQTLPGVVAPDFSASSLVRGGESDETLVRLNGIDLLEPYHIRDWGGALSVVSLDAMSEASLQRGGLPARYGRHLSAALEVQSPKRPEKTRTRLSASLSQLRALVLGPLGENGSYLVGLRHGMLAATFRTHRFDDVSQIIPDFQDALTAVRVAPSRVHMLEFLGLGTRDDTRYDEEFDGNDIVSNQRNLTVGSSWSAQWSDRVHTRLVVSADRFDREGSLGYLGRDDNRTDAFRLRLEGMVTLAGSQALEVGLAGETEEAAVGLVASQGRIVGGEYAETVLSELTGSAERLRGESYLSLSSRWSEAVSTTAGINVARNSYEWSFLEDSVQSSGERAETVVGPRLSVAGRLNRWVTARAGLGVLYQPLFLNNLSEQDIQNPADRERESREVTAGLDLSFGRMALRLEGYIRSDFGVRVPIQDQSARPPEADSLDGGHSRGVEALLKSPRLRRLDGTVAYALSEATWETSAGDVPRSFDQRHAVSLSVNVRPVGEWNVNTTARYHTGNAYTEDRWESPDGGFDWNRVYESFMGARNPDYFRLDLRVSHPLGRNGHFYFEVINLTDHVNVYNYVWSFAPTFGGGSSPSQVIIDQFPRVPGVGIEIEF